MPFPLDLYTKVMVFAFSVSYSICGTAAAGGARRIAIKRWIYPQHHLQAFSAAVLCSSNSRDFRSYFFTATRPLPHRHAFYTSSPLSWLEQPCRQARACMPAGNNSSLSSAPADSTTPRKKSQQPPSKPYAPSSNVAVTAALGGEDLERCRRLAEKLGVALIAPRQKQEKEEQRRQGERGRSTGGAVGECSDYKFTLLFDESGRLALGQPGSGFNPLVVDFSGGKTGYRAKHQQGKTEQVVKAAALPKRRAATATITDKPLQQTSLPPSSRSSDNDGPAAPLPLLWDLTAGLGTDAFLLAQAGWQVEMFERSPVVAALVQDALDRARSSDDETARTAASRMSLTVADSTDVLATVAESFSSSAPAAEVACGGEKCIAVASHRPDVVYIDPMFPEQKKGNRKKTSALVKKSMQMLQALLEEEEAGGEQDGGRQEGKVLRSAPHGVGDDGRDDVGINSGASGDEDEDRPLFDIAMSLATRKVVVKRPVHGAAIVRHVQPSHAVVSKNGRFDVYVVPP